MLQIRVEKQDILDILVEIYQHMKSSDAKASKCHLKFSSLMMIFIKLVYLSSVIYQTCIFKFSNFMVI